MPEVFSGSSFYFSSSHSLEVDTDEKGKAILHGHNFRLDLLYPAKHNDRQKIEAHWKAEVFPQLHGRKLNDRISPSSSEKLASWIWEQFKSSFKLESLHLQETRKNAVIIEAPKSV